MIESGKQYQLELLLANILNHIEHRIQDKDDTQLIDWEKRCAHLNQKVTFHSGNEIVTGVFIGLTPKGEAIVLIDGKENIFPSGEVV